MFANALSQKNIQNNSSNQIASSWFVQKEAELFSEHFEDYPILPGAFSVSLCVEAIKEYVIRTKQLTVQLKEIHKINLLKPIKPEDELMIIIKQLKKEQSNLLISFYVATQNKIQVLDGILRYEVMQ